MHSENQQTTRKNYRYFGKTIEISGGNCHIFFACIIKLATCGQHKKNMDGMSEEVPPRNSPKTGLVEEKNMLVLKKKMLCHPHGNSSFLWALD